MANAQFCPVCGDIISDGCPVLDADGNETNETNYSPCECDSGARQPAPVVGDETPEELAKRTWEAMPRTAMVNGKYSIKRDWDAGNRDEFVLFAAALREILAAQAVQVPDWAAGFRAYIQDPTPGDPHGWVAEVQRWDEERLNIVGTGATWHEALAAAIEQAKGGADASD